MKKKMIFAMKGIILAVLLFVSIFPIYWLFLMALRPTTEISSGAGLIPGQPTLEHFENLFVQKGFGTALFNSLINGGSAMAVIGLWPDYSVCAVTEAVPLSDEKAVDLLGSADSGAAAGGICDSAVYPVYENGDDGNPAADYFVLYADQYPAGDLVYDCILHGSV